MKVYITKYALTQGILEKEAEVATKVSNDMIVVKSHGKLHQYFHKPYWYTDKKQAIDHAESLKLKKINSLKKSIDKLAKIRFS